jgi:hypothetical protein
VGLRRPTLLPRPVKSNSYDKHSLVIIALQLFRFYEGLLHRVEHDPLLTEKFPLWFEIGRIFNTDTVLIPPNFLPPDPKTGLARTTGDRNVIVSDLRQIADPAKAGAGVGVELLGTIHEPNFCCNVPHRSTSHFCQDPHTLHTNRDALRQLSSGTRYF